MDSAGGAFHVQGFFFSGSLLSTNAYYVEKKAFPKEWVDMKAFLEKDDLKLRASIRGFAKAYKFSIMKEWTGINRLPITSTKDTSKMTLKFCIQLLVRSYPGLPSSTFSIGPVAELDSVGIDVAVDDVLFNLVMKDTQFMNGSIPWRGGREKDPLFLQLLIESTTQVGDIVLDCTTSTGQHFVAMEGDKEIFKAILEPFNVDNITEGFKKQRLDGVDAADDDAMLEELGEYPDPDL